MISKTLSGSYDIEADRININGPGLPLTINNVKLNLEHLLPTEIITGNGESNSSLLLPKVHIKDGDIFIVDKNGNLQKVVHAGNVSDLETDLNTGKVKAGSIISAGSNFHIQQSPAPVAFVNTAGNLDSRNLWHTTFLPYILGNADTAKPDFYSHGLVRAGSQNHSHQFLRKDGQWAQPSVTYSGTVAENFLSLNDTPSSYTGAENKYVRVTYSGGGGLEFNQPTTDEVTEATNLYYTDARVATKTSNMLSSGDISSLLVNGNITADSFISTSDKRFKSNIKSLQPDYCNEITSQFDPCEYNLKDVPRKRSSDCDTGAEISGAAVFVQRGSDNADTAWVMSTDQVSLNTTELNWIKFSHVGGVTGGNGITVTGNSVAVTNGGVTDAMLAGSINPNKISNGITSAQISALATSKLDGFIANTQLAGSIPDSKIADLDAAKLTGTLSINRIADSSITSGKLDSVATSKLTGTIGDSGISDLDAAKLTGTLSADRLATNSIDGTKLIGTSVTQSKLSAGAVGTSELIDASVNGNKLTSDINISTTGTVTAASFTASSDRRLKENINPIRNAMDIVAQVNPVAYNFIQEPGKRRSGVVAQELETQLPHLVEEDDYGMKSVNYTDLIAYLVQSVKELNQRLKSLESPPFLMS